MQEHDGNNPYAAPSARIEQQHDANAEGHVLASRGTRLAAYIVDGLVVGVWFIPAYWAWLGPNADAPGALTFLALLVGIALFAYNLVLLHQHGQSIAKRWMNIRIVRADGTRAGLGRIFSLRMLVPGLISAIPLIGNIFGLADALFIFGEERRTLHDRIADTIVVEA
jgi:uncharacterized RDD family membrane protein YckC